VQKGMQALKNVHIISGGTISHIRPHLALCAPVYGSTGEVLAKLCDRIMSRAHTVILQQTKMAGGHDLETIEDISDLLDELIAKPQTKIIFMPVAICDYEVMAIGNNAEMYTAAVGKEYSRLKTSEGDIVLECWPTDKLIGKIRKERKDIFLVGFKTTTGATEDEMFSAGLKLLKKNSCNLVLANDIETRTNMVITPELARYAVTKDRLEALKTLVEMTYARSQLTFHRTNVVSSLQLIKWNSHRVPEVLRKVVNYCVERGAYRSFNGVTVGHFGVFESLGAIEYQIYSSRRKKNYNEEADKDLVVVTFDREGNPTAYGEKPSAGVRSQYEVFKDNPGFDCVVHFHCKIKEGSSVTVRPQQHLECGSLECGMNTRDGMTQHSNDIKAVMLDKHGPNILFKRNADPEEVIEFIEVNFDLDSPTSEL
jgi:hypothetical protein